MSINDRKIQINKLQDLVSDGKDINVAEEFDELVDYLQDHGYDIVKRDYPETTEERVRSYAKKLMKADSPRSAAEVERGIKDMARRAAVKTEDVMEIWHSQMKNVMERASNTGQTEDFAQLVEYIKAGHSIINQTQNNESV
jgi:DNA-directed RNA polymerase subunit F